MPAGGAPGPPRAGVVAMMRISHYLCMLRVVSTGFLMLGRVFASVFAVPHVCPARKRCLFFLASCMWLLQLPIGDFGDGTHGGSTSKRTVEGPLLCFVNCSALLRCSFILKQGLVNKMQGGGFRCRLVVLQDRHEHVWSL